jgi:hypothetical protein
MRLLVILGKQMKTITGEAGRVHGKRPIGKRSSEDQNKIQLSIKWTMSFPPRARLEYKFRFRNLPMAVLTILKKTAGLSRSAGLLLLAVTVAYVQQGSAQQPATGMQPVIFGALRHI